MKSNGLFKKMLFIFTLNFTLILTAFILISSYYLKQNNIKVFTEDLQSSAQFLTPFIADLYAKGSYKEIDQKLKNFKGDYHRITLVSAEGSVLADSHLDPASMENHSNREEIKEVFKAERSVSIRHSSTLGEDLLYVAVPVYVAGQKAAALRIDAPVRNITLLSKDFFAKNISMLLAVLALALVCAYIFSRLLTGRIIKLKDAFVKLAGGDFTARTNIHSGDELQTLSSTFNLMSERMAAAFKDSERSRAELRGVIDSVKDKVLVIKKDGTVVLSNEASYKDKFYWELPGLSALGRAIEQKTSAEIEVDGVYYSCSVAAIKNTSNTVVVMHDITEIKNLEIIKNDFISNMSHELKTPLSSVKAYLELIADEKDEETKKEYLSVIERNNERLSNITNDILLLASVEEKKRFNPELFKLNEALKEVSSLLKQKAEAKGLYLNINAEDVTLTADKFYIEQMLINLVDNAIRYTEKGGVTLSAQRDDFGVKITVSDTGLGISKENRARVFERFFVADKSRSKRLGGTGLGLAIVKHIVELHGGQVALSSEPNLGTTFVVRLP